MVRARNLLYDLGWKRRRALPCRVVSVGNVTVGGTGKTPVVIWIVEWLLDQGWRVGVLSRGYRRSTRIPYVLVSDGCTLLTGPEEAGDEPYLIAERCPRAIVAVGADRYHLGRWVLKRFALDYIVLDDGFQHRSLQRDVDLVLVDASDHAGLDALLPAGRLREPLSSISRASALLLTRADTEREVSAVRTRLSASLGSDLDPVLIRFDADGYVHVSSGAVKALDEAVDRRSVLFSGIGNADSFRTLLIRHRVKVEDAVVFPDHHAYTKTDLNRVRERAQRVGADLLLTTEKDAVKIRSLITADDSVWAVRLRTDVVDGGERLRRLLVGTCM